MTIEKLADGVYFGLPEADYLAQPHLGSSSIKALLQSPLTYWANSEHNPRKQRVETPSTIAGTAYHKRFLEGELAFLRSYAKAFNPAMYPEALRTQADLKERLAELGEKVSGTKAEQTARLLAIEPDAQIIDMLEERYQAANAGRSFLPPEIWDNITFAWQCLEQSGAHKLFAVGAPEVSIFWHDEDGTPLKARIDYVKRGSGISLKTFNNPQKIPLGRLPGVIIARDRHDISAYCEIQAIEKARAFIADGMFHVMDDAKFDGSPVEVMAEIKGQKQPTYTFVFQEQGAAPNVIAVEFMARDVTGAPTEYWQKARDDTRAALKTYREFAEAVGFGGRPWVYEVSQPEQLDDADFPAYHIKS